MTASVARNISYQLSELRRSVRLLALANIPLLQKLHANPNNSVLQAKLRNIVSQQFPRSFAVTLAASNGELLLDNFNGNIGEICIRDINSFTSSGQEPPAVVHPNPDGYHIDIMIRVMIDPGTPAILFISFFAELFSPLLSQNQAIGQRFLITNSKHGKLIELTSGGSRKQLGKEVYLNDSEHQQIIASSPVQGATWNVIALPHGNQAGLFTGGVSSSLLWTIAFIILFSALSAFLAFRSHRQQRRMQQDLANIDDNSLFRQRQCAQPLLEIMSRTGSKSGLHGTMHHCLSHLLKLSHSQHGMILERSGQTEQGYMVHILAFLHADDMLSSATHLNTQYYSPDSNSVIGHALTTPEVTCEDQITADSNTGLPSGYPDTDTLYVKTIEFNGVILGTLVLTNWEQQNADSLEDYSAIINYCAMCLKCHKQSGQA